MDYLLRRLRTSADKGSMQAFAAHDRAIEAGASDEIALRCGARFDASHGSRKTFRQAKPSTTADAQAKVRKIHARAANLADIARETVWRNEIARVNPTRANKRKARKLASEFR